MNVVQLNVVQRLCRDFCLSLLLLLLWWIFLEFSIVVAVEGGGGYLKCRNVATGMTGRDAEREREIDAACCN